MRNNNRGLPIDIETVASFVRKRGSAGTLALPEMPRLLTERFPPIVPCAFLHPQEVSCARFSLRTFLDTAKKTLPLYATLTFVPMIVLQFLKFLRYPIPMTIRALLSCLRSTCFLALFCALYGSVVCAQRNLVSVDHRSIYYLAGVISSLSILIEKKSRRGELALYVLPRAVDSLYMQLLDRKWMASVPHGDLALFCVAMGGLMYFYKKQPSTMSPALHYGFNWLLTYTHTDRLGSASKQ